MYRPPSSESLTAQFVFSSCPWCAWASCLVVSDSCDPVDCSPAGSSVHWILQARILVWVAISLSRKASQPPKRTWVSCIAGRLLTSFCVLRFLILNSVTWNSLYEDSLKCGFSSLFYRPWICFWCMFGGTAILRLFYPKCLYLGEDM